MHFMAVKKSKKRSGDTKFLTWYVIGVSFVNRKYTKGTPFLSIKMRGLPGRITLC